jgi:hydroxymethylpyrimidine/phosphomethylpyrimidine kinase
VPPHIIAAQIDALFADLAVGAVKIGMLSVPLAIGAVAAGLERWRQTHVVLDPVMIASSRRPLLAPEAVALLMRELIPRALVVTPNRRRQQCLLASLSPGPKTKCAHKPSSCSRSGRSGIV